MPGREGEGPGAEDLLPEEGLTSGKRLRLRKNVRARFLIAYVPGGAGV